MPGGDRTGPLGAGPMSGRAAGFCGGNGMPGYMNWGFGRGGSGFGRGRGFGRGFRAGAGRGFGFGYAGYASPMRAADEKEMLKGRNAEIEEELKAIKERMKE
ncbi:MAG TPA: hypothetical protein ENN43_03980, partial [bacterium]|nr:hypothetical protein [bacterium]